MRASVPRSPTAFAADGEAADAEDDPSQGCLEPFAVREITDEEDAEDEGKDREDHDLKRRTS